MTHEDSSAACSYLQEVFISFSYPKRILSCLLEASNISPLTLSLQSSVQDWGEEVEEGAIYNVTLKRVQIQQAANKGARWLGVSRPAWCFPVWQNHSWWSFFKDKSSSKPSAKQIIRMKTWCCFFHSINLLKVQNVNCRFYSQSGMVSPLELIKCRWFYKSNLVCRLLIIKRESNLCCLKQWCLSIVGRLSALCSTRAVVLTFEL